MFDFSFRHFITLSFAKVIFVIAIVIACLWYVGILITGFGGSMLGARYGGTVIFGLLALLFGWIPPALFLILVRLGLEFSVATIRTAQNTSILAERE